MLKFSKIRDVKTPIRAHASDSGIDFFIPKFDFDFEQRFNEIEQNKNNEINKDTRKIILKPNEGILIPAGIKINLPAGYDMVIHDKSGVASKLGLLVGSKVIDESYQGEIHINLWNVSNELVTIKEDQKIVQGIIRKVNTMGLQEVPENKLYTEKSERAEAGFGSTDNK